MTIPPLTRAPAPAPTPNGAAPTEPPHAPTRIERWVSRWTLPAQAPFVSLTLYYSAILALWAVLLWLFPAIRPAVTGERLAALAADGASFAALTEGATAGSASEWISWRFSLLLGVAMVGAFQLMIPASWVYMATRRKKGFDQNMVQTMIVLALAVAGVVVIVRNSLALAFSLAGIVGAVRFRNSLPDTRDTLYIFLSIGVGLAAGVEALGAGLVLSMVFNFAVLSMWRADYGMCELGCSATHLLHAPAWARATAVNGTPSPAPPVADDRAKDRKGRKAKDAADGRKAFNAVLVVRARGADAARGRATVEPFLAQETKRWELAEVERNPAAEESVLRYRVRLGRKAQPEALEDALLAHGAPTLVGARLH